MSVTVSGVSVLMSGYVCASMWCVCVACRCENWMGGDFRGGQEDH